MHVLYIIGYPVVVLMYTYSQMLLRSVWGPSVQEGERGALVLSRTNFLPEGHFPVASTCATYFQLLQCPYVHWQCGKADGFSRTKTESQEMRCGSKPGGNVSWAAACWRRTARTAVVSTASSFLVEYGGRRKSQVFTLPASHAVVSPFVQ